MPYKANYETHLKSSRQKVFAALMDFGGLKPLLPEGAVISVDCEGTGIGAVRTIQLGEASGFPGQVIERLDVAYDERVFGYSIMGTPSLPIDDYVAVVELSDAPDGGCHAKWCSNWVTTGDLSDQEMATNLAGLYEAILSNF
ncbi:MAG: SRPBCC family protein [Gammaproteobacteria bacterium]